MASLFHSSLDDDNFLHTPKHRCVLDVSLCLLPISLGHNERGNASVLSILARSVYQAFSLFPAAQ